jgi:carboxyl-terminal processing protease
VATKGRTAEDDSDERAKWEKTWRIPLVVLVDHDSASASEIFAAAIQENQRGVVVGRQTYGKGTVQTHFPLQTVSGTLKMTTAKFYSPSGREMSGVGVRPDFPVAAANGELFAGPLTQDQDVQAALQVIARGIPSQLANAPTQPRGNATVPQLGN